MDHIKSRPSALAPATKRLPQSPITPASSRGSTPVAANSGTSGASSFSGAGATNQKAILSQYTPAVASAATDGAKGPAQPSSQGPSGDWKKLVTDPGGATFNLPGLGALPLPAPGKTAKFDLPAGDFFKVRMQQDGSYEGKYVPPPAAKARPKLLNSVPDGTPGLWQDLITNPDQTTFNLPGFDKLPLPPAGETSQLNLSNGSTFQVRMQQDGSYEGKFTAPPPRQDSAPRPSAGHSGPPPAPSHHTYKKVGDEVQLAVQPDGTFRVPGVERVFNKPGPGRLDEAQVGHKKLFRLYTADDGNVYGWFEKQKNKEQGGFFNFVGKAITGAFNFVGEVAEVIQPVTDVIGLVVPGAQPVTLAIDGISTAHKATSGKLNNPLAITEAALSFVSGPLKDVAPGLAAGANTVRPYIQGVEGVKNVVDGVGQIGKGNTVGGIVEIIGGVASTSSAAGQVSGDPGIQDVAHTVQTVSHGVGIANDVNNTIQAVQAGDFSNAITSSAGAIANGINLSRDLTPQAPQASRPSAAPSPAQPQIKSLLDPTLTVGDLVKMPDGDLAQVVSPERADSVTQKGKWYPLTAKAEPTSPSGVTGRPFGGSVADTNSNQPVGGNLASTPLPRDFPMTTRNGFTDVGYAQTNTAYRLAVEELNAAGRRFPNHVGNWLPPSSGVREFLNGFAGPVIGDLIKENSKLNQNFAECSDQAMANANSMNNYFKSHGLSLEAGFQFNNGHAWTVIRDRNDPNGPVLYGDSWQNWPDVSTTAPGSGVQGTVWPPP